MAILAALFGVVGRFAGELLTMSLGWASVLLFGCVPRDKQIFLAAITFGSVIWVVLIVGVLHPRRGSLPALVRTDPGLGGRNDGR